MKEREEGETLFGFTQLMDCGMPILIEDLQSGKCGGIHCQYTLKRDMMDGIDHERGFGG